MDQILPRANDRVAERAADRICFDNTAPNQQEYRAATRTNILRTKTVIPGREQSERTRNPEQRMVLDSGMRPRGRIPE
jgi:hypothetical protein